MGQSVRGGGHCHTLGRAIAAVSDTSNGEVTIADVKEVQVVYGILREHRMSETAREVVDSRRYTGLGLGHLQDKGLLRAAGEGVADPLSAVPDAAAVTTVFR